MVTRSRPWSKNWPKKVIHELKPAVRPTSGDSLGMKNTSLSSAVPNTPSRPGLITGVAPPFAATAAGLLAVWSTIRLLIIRGCGSITVPVPAYCADRKEGSSRRGKSASAAPKSVWPVTRLLKLPSTVRRPNGT
ncbi:hypothetical protein D3C85_997540 [compost metagenome]